MKILGYNIGIHKEEKEEKVTPITIPQEIQSDFTKYVEYMKKATGKSDVEVLKDVFSDGWLNVMIEETGANLRIDAGQLMKQDDTDKDPIEECIRLRKKFGPVSSCVEYIKQQLIGGGIDVIIKDAKNPHQKEMKEDLELFIENVYQDDITIGLNVLLPILIDNSLTTGAGTAEIAYKTDVSFWDYAEVNPPEKVTVDKNDVSIVTYKIKEPQWSELEGIKRLKIFSNGYKLFTPQRDVNSMEIEYWNVEDGSKDVIKLPNGQKYRKYNSNNKKAGLYLHNWQLFYLSLNREDSMAKSESIVLPVLSISQILEKIMGAVGEGLYRAGNKRYFIVMGSEKRPWGGPFIRNVLQQLKEARAKNWSTIPMPQGFDIKEMGGEVFDAKEVVDYLLKTIAKGMNCPAKTVGVEVKEEESFSYQTFKTNLFSAIRNQLFKRHIWAKHGQTKSKQGGSSDDIYIPMPRIKVEELLSLKERIELFSKTFNVANPINPLIKIKSEIEYCKIMGWNDVLAEFPSIEEYAKELEKAKKDMEKQLKEKNEKSEENNPLGEKRQGEPKPQTKEQQEKRLEGMQNKGKTNKGQAKGLGDTRIPTEVQETLEEGVETQVEPIEHRLEITVKNESEPHKLEISPIVVKTESTPQVIEIKHEPLKITTNATSPLDNVLQTLLKKQTELVESETSRNEKLQELDLAKSENAKKKIDTEIEQLNIIIETKKKEIKKINAEIEKIKSEQEEIKKTEEEKQKTEEEKQKTEEKKRATLDKIEEKIE